MAKTRNADANDHRNGGKGFESQEAISSGLGGTRNRKRAHESSPTSGGWRGHQPMYPTAGFDTLAEWNDDEGALGLMVR